MRIVHHKAEGHPGKQNTIRSHWSHRSNHHAHGASRIDRLFFRERVHWPVSSRLISLPSLKWKCNADLIRTGYESNYSSVIAYVHLLNVATYHKYGLKIFWCNIPLHINHVKILITIKQKYICTTLQPHGNQVHPYWCIVLELWK